MLTLLKQKVFHHIKINKIPYSLLFSALFIGAVAGGIAARLAPHTIESLITDMSIFFSTYSLFGADNLATFSRSALANIQVIFLIFISGFFRATVPLIFLWVGSVGFKIGFSTIFFISAYSAGGALLAALLIWIPNLIFLPILLCFAMSSIRTAGIMHKLKSCGGAKALKRKLYVNHIKEFLFFCALAIICGGIEAFVLPTILRPIVGLFV